MKKSVLIVDANAISCSLIEAILCQMQCQVFIAYSEYEIFDMLSEEMMDLILISQQSTGIDGLNLFLKIKELCPSIPVIGIGNGKDKKLPAKWIQAGGADFLKRPFGLNDLKAKLQQALNKKERLCDDPDCLPGCLFCARIRQTTDEVKLRREKNRLEEIIEDAIKNEDRESVDDLSKKKKVIKRKLYQMK